MPISPQEQTPVISLVLWRQSLLHSHWLTYAVEHGPTPKESKDKQQVPFIAAGSHGGSATH
jgi:hypothetical protein